ncbi:MAG: metal-dependent hydrolase [Anaerolineae bacterium]
MQTYSHLLITAVLSDQIQRKKAVNPGKAFLLGSVLPDIPLFILSVGHLISRRMNPGAVDSSLFGASFDTLYLTNPWWIAAHNLFHAPLLILLYTGVGYGLLRQTVRPGWQKWGRPLLWFAAGCGLHSLCDIFTHVTDGPVIFFPFNWHYRFRAPISYWDPRYGGRIFGPIENVCDLGLLIYLGQHWWQGRKHLQRGQSR